MSRFNDFWEVYPKKQGKAGAKKKWELKKLDEKADMIIDHVKARADTDKKWQTLEYVPMPTTFINQERWEDEYEKKDVPTQYRPTEVIEHTMTFGVRGMATAYGMDPDIYTEEEINQVVWARRFGCFHLTLLPKHLYRAYVGYGPK